MKPITPVVAMLLVSALPGTAQVAPQNASPLGAEERASLTAASQAGLEELRAASLGSGSGLGVIETSSLRELERRHQDLDRLRAGELTLSDDDIKLILITAGIVIIIALIL